MTMTNKSTPSQGYSICDCGEGVLLHEAGYEVDLHMCAVCRCMVADPDDFDNRKQRIGYEYLSKCE